MSEKDRKELLDKQLQLLAEKSEESDAVTLVELTHAMSELYQVITL